VIQHVLLPPLLYGTVRNAQVCLHDTNLKIVVD
jgi:hypothetical protein